MSKKNSLGDLADAVIQKINSTELEKTATVSYTRGTKVNSETATLLTKVASQMREVANNPTRITYDDIAQYRKRHDRS